MASAVAANAPSIVRPVFQAVANTFDFLVQLGSANQMAQDMEHLLSLSDEQLAKRGLTREELPQYVLKNYWMV